MQLADVWSFLDRACAVDGARPLLGRSSSSSYGEIRAAATAVAGGLQHAGVQPGDRVVSVLPNDRHAVVLFLACLRVGAIFVPLNPQLSTTFLQAEIAQCSPRICVVDEVYRDVVAKVVGDCAHLAVVNAPPEFNGARFEELARPGERLPGREEAGRRPAVILYTSGTTQDPKGCILTENYLCHIGEQANTRSGRNADEVLWTPLPLFHINALAGSLVSTLRLGGCLDLSSRFSASSFWAEVHASRASIAHLIGPLLAIVAKSAETEQAHNCYGQLRFVAGVPCSAQLRATWQRRFGVPVVGSGVYGMTEACQITTTPFGEIGPGGDGGRRSTAFEVRIVDERGRPLPDGDVGEIECLPQRPHIMYEGYWNNPAATAARVRRGWFRTYDLGWFDGDGWLRFAGRRDDIIRRLGENVDVHEVERVLAEHDSVAEVAVVGMPTDLGEEEICAVIVPARGSRVSAADLHAYAATMLPRMYVPRFFDIRADIPRSSMGRPVKRAILADRNTDEFWDARTMS